MGGMHETDGVQRTLWNGPAGRAWVDAQGVLDRVLQPFEDLLVDAVARESPDAVLDIGCGTGSTTVAIARLLGGRGRCTGVDLSDTMIAAARTRAAREHAPADFISADAQHYVFEPASVDMIVSRFGVMFFDDPVAAFVNLRRAARDDAALRFIAWRSAGENPFMTTAERAAAPLLPNLPARQPGAPGQFAFADAAHVSRILKESGWTAIETRALDVECTLPESDLMFYLTRLGPVGLALQDADDGTRTRVIDVLRTEFQRYIEGDVVRFTAACWMVSARGGVRS